MAEFSVDKMARTVAKRAIQELKDNGVFVARWIPVSEGSPEEGTWVFITFVDELSSGISIAYYSENSWHGNIEKYDIVTAWMPMPEPYVEGESE